MITRTLFHACNLAKELQAELNVAEDWPTAVRKSYEDLKAAYADAPDVNLDHIYDCAALQRSSDQWVIRVKQYLQNHYGNNSKRKYHLGQYLKWSDELAAEEAEVTAPTTKQLEQRKKKVRALGNLSPVSRESCFTTLTTI